MTPISKLPNLNWNEIARQEIVLSGANLVELSDFAYQIGKVAIAGLVYHSYTSPPEFWFALAKDVTIRDLIDFRRLREKIPLGAITYIREDRAEAVRFAEFYGFEDTSRMLEYGGLSYKIFRRA